MLGRLILVAGLGRLSATGLLSRPLVAGWCLGRLSATGLCLLVGLLDGLGGAFLGFHGGLLGGVGGLVVSNVLNYEAIILVNVFF